MPLHFKKYTSTDYVKQPWPNGAGTTLELARDDREPYRWRVSRAHMAKSSPFSPFPKYERVILTLGHQTIWLLHGGGKKRVLPSLTPYTFSGDIDTSAEIVAPTDDFNLFCLKGAAEGKVYPTYFRTSQEMQLPIAGQEHFVYCLEGDLKLFDQNSKEEMQVASQELVRLSRTDKKEYLNVKAMAKDPHTTMLWIVVHVF